MAGVNREGGGGAALSKKRSLEWKENKMEEDWDGVWRVDLQRMR